MGEPGDANRRVCTEKCCGEPAVRARLSEMHTIIHLCLPHRNAGDYAVLDLGEINPMHMTVLLFSQ